MTAASQSTGVLPHRPSSPRSVVDEFDIDLRVSLLSSSRFDSTREEAATVPYTRASCNAACTCAATSCDTCDPCTR